MTRVRARLSRHATQAKNELHTLLTRVNQHPPYADAFCQSGIRWLISLDLGVATNLLRDEILRRLEHYENEIGVIDDHLRELAQQFPQIEALRELHGGGLYTALLIVAEIGEPWRFKDGRKVGAYAGLTARVRQSANLARYGSITRQGAPWLRWMLVQVAMQIVSTEPWKYRCRAWRHSPRAWWASVRAPVRLH